MKIVGLSFTTAIFVLHASGCAYHFVNQPSRPDLIHTNIAIEAIYDTAYDVIPHEILWEELQRTIASAGVLRLTSSKNADLYLRLHLSKSDRVQINIEYPDLIDETNSINLNGTTLKPHQHRNLNQADRYAKTERNTISIKAEVYKMRSKELIFGKFYKMIIDNPIEHPDSPIDTRPIRAQESYEINFRRQSERVSSSIYADLMKNL